MNLKLLSVNALQVLISWSLLLAIIYSITLVEAHASSDENGVGESDGGNYRH